MDQQNRGGAHQPLRSRLLDIFRAGDGADLPRPFAIRSIGSPSHTCPVCARSEPVLEPVLDSSIRPSFADATGTCFTCTRASLPRPGRDCQRRNPSFPDFLPKRAENVFPCQKSADQTFAHRPLRPALRRGTSHLLAQPITRDKKRKSREKQATLSGCPVTLRIEPFCEDSRGESTTNATAVPLTTVLIDADGKSEAGSSLGKALGLRRLSVGGVIPHLKGLGMPQASPIPRPRPPQFDSTRPPTHKLPVSSRASARSLPGVERGTPDPQDRLAAGCRVGMRRRTWNGLQKLRRAKRCERGRPFLHFRP